jgi:ATP-dependent RNA helicase RhlB
VADLGLVRAIVFDEADRMFDMGFKDDMKFILKRVPRERQFLVFSATLNFDVLAVAYEFGSDPVEVNISRDQAKAENVKDHIIHLGHTDKPQYLLSIIRKNEPRQAIIFSNFKHNVERLSKFLTSNDVPAVGISSLMTQAQRNRVMTQFKGESDRNILVATDVAARGLDILGVDLVINYDLPDDPENYVHRIGRTGRAGQTGNALSLVGDRDVDALQRIEDYLKHKVETLWLDEAHIVQEYKPLPRDEERYKKPGADRPPREEGRGAGGAGRGRGGPRGARRDGPREEGAEGAAAGGRESHRDRASGRHRDGESKREPRAAKTTASGAPKGGSRIVKATPEQRAAAKHGGGAKGGRGKGSHPGVRKAAAQKQGGLGSKVSGFFKKLFGG